MLKQSTHVEIETIDQKKFLIKKDKILTVLQEETPEQYAEKLGKPTMALILTDEEDEEGKKIRMIVRNSYNQLKKQLV